MKIKILSLGCRLNQAEMQSIATKLQDNGHELIADAAADLFIINSCIVTNTSERKTRKLINQSLRACNIAPDKKVIVTGCAAGIVPQREKVLCISNDYKYLIPEIVENWGSASDLENRAISRFDYKTPLKAIRTRVHLKIQDGCDKCCSYCIIPIVRGTSQSKPVAQVLKAFEELVDTGYKEIVLTGVMIGNYLWEGIDLASLVAMMLLVRGDYRIHLSSLNPDSLSPKLCELLKDAKMVRHLHLSLQSGSDEVLRKMNRRYTCNDYMALVDAIKRDMPLFNFTTDCIVGFPGETERNHLETLDMIRRVGFSHVHTFRYSPRPGTEAARLSGVVPEAEKTRRSGEVIVLYSAQKTEYYKKFEGRASRFLSEKYRKGFTSGFNEFYVPISVSEELPRNRFLQVITTYDATRLRLRGSLLDNAVRLGEN